MVATPENTHNDLDAAAIENVQKRVTLKMLQAEFARIRGEVGNRLDRTE